jgi:hypothetical protein
MKAALLLLTSSLVIVASGAFAQGNSDACHNQYASCMERCSSRPASMQEACSTSCEANTNQCYAGLYGTTKSSAQVLPSASAPDQAAAAAEDNEASTAHDEAKTKTKKKKK